MAATGMCFCTQKKRPAGRFQDAGVSTTQVGITNFRVYQQFFAGALHDHATVFQHVGAIGDLQGLVGVLLYQEDGDAITSQLFESLPAGSAKVAIAGEEARRRGLREGEAIRVRNSFGSVVAMLAISDDVPEGVASMPKGLWRRSTKNTWTANALAPGFFPSRMTKGTIEAVGVEKLAAGAPLRRIGDEDDLKGAAVLFASDAGKHITGQILAVDGGLTSVISSS